MPSQGKCLNQVFWLSRATWRAVMSELLSTAQKMTKQLVNNDTSAEHFGFGFSFLCWYLVAFLKPFRQTACMQTHRYIRFRLNNEYLLDMLPVSTLDIVMGGATTAIKLSLEKRSLSFKHMHRLTQYQPSIQSSGSSTTSIWYLVCCMPLQLSCLDLLTMVKGYPDEVLLLRLLRRGMGSGPSMSSTRPCHRSCSQALPSGGLVGLQI
jgi:hypothetical protein